MSNLPTIRKPALQKREKPKRETIHQKLDAIMLELVKLRSDLATTFGDEFSDKRKEMSNRLAEEMDKRLKAEDWARRHTLGEV